MRTFEQLCQAIYAAKKRNGYYCGWGYGEIGVTFNTYKDMWAFMKTKEYMELRKYRILSPYTKFLYFQNR